MSCLAYSSTVKMEATCRLTFNVLHGIMSQETELLRNIPVPVRKRIPVTHSTDCSLAETFYSLVLFILWDGYTSHRQSFEHRVK
jgi:hypothetical protein